MAGTPTAVPSRSRVLLVDDDPDDAAMTMRDLLASHPYEIVHVRTAADALVQMQAGTFDICLLDYRLPDMSGIVLCRHLRAAGFALPILMLTSVGDDQVAEMAYQAGANAFLIKDTDRTGRLARRVADRVEASHAA